MTTLPTEEVSVEALCNGCGGRVMPYHQYFIHFRSTAVCDGCGRTVTLRHFRRVLLGFVGLGGAFLLLLLVTRRPALLAVGMALAVVVAVIADFWTFRNLPWDPADEQRPSDPQGYTESVSAEAEPLG